MREIYSPEEYQAWLAGQESNAPSDVEKQQPKKDTPESQLTVS
jgi:hypothetical protein